MTESQYWDEDATKVIYYRKAEELRVQRLNQEMWLQGMYHYDIMCRVSPIFHDFAKKGTKPVPYMETPYPLGKDKVEKKKEKKAKATYEKGLSYMEALKAKYDKHFKEKGGKSECQT